jgi:hypothetical protein
MTDKRTVQIVAGGLVLIVLVGLVGLLWLIHDVEVEPATIALVVGIVTGALGGLIGLLSGTGSVDVGDVKSAAYNKALADVSTLTPSGPPEPPPLVAGGIIPEPFDDQWQDEPTT